ncbi:MAG: hypothetical protein K2O06_12120 [Acetatifactor sp.]|nr:hypothetical protein [Acetatifactor sp.]
MAKAKEAVPETSGTEDEKQKVLDDKKQLKKEQKEQKKEAKRRAREIAKQEEALGMDEGNGLVTFGATVLIVALWIAVICVIVKLDVGGFGSRVLTPILKDVPVLNLILPGSALGGNSTTQESYGGYSDLKEAVDRIRELELELDRVQTGSNSKDSDLEQLRAEVARLKEFEAKQVEFQRIMNEFYEEVVYSDKGPGIEEFKKYYEAMDPATAEFLYKQVVLQQEEDEEIKQFVKTYTEMNAKKAAKIFEGMTSDLAQVARILEAMTAEQRSKILEAMDAEVAARLTKMMDPSS